MGLGTSILMVGELSEEGFGSSAALSLLLQAPRNKENKETTNKENIKRDRMINLPLARLLVLHERASPHLSLRPSRPTPPPRQGPWGAVPHQRRSLANALSWHRNTDLIP